MTWLIMDDDDDLGMKSSRTQDVLNGSYHDNFGTYFKEHLLKKIKPNGRFIDGGASYGWFVPMLYDYVNSVDCFEIREDVCAFLKQNMKNFGFDVTAHAVGLSSYSGKAHRDNGIIRGFTNWSGHSKIVDEDQEGAIECSVNTLDSYNFDDVSFIKLDVEGHEFEALKGAQNTIKKSRPVCMVECHKRTDPSIKQEIFKFFYGLNYYVYDIHRLDVIFVPEERN